MPAPGRCGKALSNGVPATGILPGLADQIGLGETVQAVFGFIYASPIPECWTVMPQSNRSTVKV